MLSALRAARLLGRLSPQAWLLPPPVGSGRHPLLSPQPPILHFIAAPGRAVLSAQGAVPSRALSQP